MFVYSKEKCSDFIMSLHMDLREARQEINDAKDGIAWFNQYQDSDECKKRTKDGEKILAKRLNGKPVSDNDMEFAHGILRNRHRMTDQVEKSLAVVEQNEKRVIVLEEALRQMTITLELLNTIYNK